mmetsp:Transcript_30141/g.45668  ORF Transcript_30141/g.45668 Transcript_30141/m.45668 type:complete len:99 (-) Transcript_30141:49-345(-)
MPFSSPSPSSSPCSESTTAAASLIRSETDDFFSKDVDTPILETVGLTVAPTDRVAGVNAAPREGSNKDVKIKEIFIVQFFLMHQITMEKLYMGPKSKI